MPAPVPAGYTRGALVVIGATTNATVQEQLLQRFWTEAGGYGARLLICGAAGMDQQSNAFANHLRNMEAASVDLLPIQDRQTARMTEHQTMVERATGILLLAPSPLHIAALIGGTPLATAIRRANAIGKTVAGAGPSAPILCQHILTQTAEQDATAPLLQRDLIQFAPGLGMVNRLLLAVEPLPRPASQQIAGLLTAVAYNPFLVGVDIEANTGIVIYPDTTLEVFGANNVLIVDGHAITHTDVTTIARPGAGSVHGVQLHVLRHGQTFTFDTHVVKPAPLTDIPAEGAPNHQMF